MSTVRQRRESRAILKLIPLVLFLLTFLLSPAAARAQKSDEFDEYKIRFDAGWFYSYPSGTIRAQGDTYPVDLTKDLNFNNYSTFSGKVDWKFTHKNHLYVVIVPFWTSRTTTLSRDIVWDGNPISAGAVVQSQLHAFEVAPGYQYDIIRRKRGTSGHCRTGGCFPYLCENRHCRASYWRWNASSRSLRQQHALGSHPGCRPAIPSVLDEFAADLY